MILDSMNGRLIDNLGWVDRGFLWVYTIATHETKMVPVGNAGYLIIKQGSFGYFLVICGTDLSVRHVAEPENPLATVSVSSDGAVFTGDSKLWVHVDTNVRIEDEHTGAKLIHVDASQERIRYIDLSWYNNDTYDLGYQGLTDCMTLPDGSRLVVSVQRSSSLVIIDLEENRQVGSIALADRGGNPALRMRTPGDFLASDYDTMCRVQISDMQVATQTRLQRASGGTPQWIGYYHLNDDDTLVVARPFSGDVLLVDSRDFSVLSSAQIACQPLVARRISNTEVLARDWTSGQPHIGRFMR